MGTEKNYKRGNFYYTFFYFLYMNSKFHYKYAGLFFVQTDHHSQKNKRAYILIVLLNTTSPMMQHCHFPAVRRHIDLAPKALSFSSVLIRTHPTSSVHLSSPLPMIIISLNPQRRLQAQVGEKLLRGAIIT